VLLKYQKRIQFMIIKIVIRRIMQLQSRITRKHPWILNLKNTLRETLNEKTKEMMIWTSIASTVTIKKMMRFSIRLDLLETNSITEATTIALADYLSTLLSETWLTPTLWNITTIPELITCSSNYYIYIKYPFSLSLYKKTRTITVLI